MTSCHILITEILNITETSKKNLCVEIRIYRKLTLPEMSSTSDSSPFRSDLVSKSSIGATLAKSCMREQRYAIGT